MGQNQSDVMFGRICQLAWTYHAPSPGVKYAIPKSLVVHKMLKIN